jgi:hypothetical protein
MNTSKIAALYADPIFNTLLRFPNFDKTTTLTQQVMEHLMREARVTSEDGRTYYFQASYAYRRDIYRDEVGHRASGFFDASCSKRVADWLLGQLPGWPAQGVAHLRKGMPEVDTLLINVMGYRTEDNGPETVCGMRYGAQKDFEVVLRGMASLRRKRRKQAKKLEAQLRAYHQQQQQQQLRQGQWLGAEKALITAARVDEPGIPFMGDANLTKEQRQQLSYWAVPADRDMEAAFPEGTGLALKQVHRSRELVEGAVYLYQCQWGTGDYTLILGRARLADRQRGSLRLHCDDRPSAFSMSLEWHNPMLKVFRVVYYTTRNAAAFRPLSSADFLALPMEEQRAYDQQLELANAA